jgi:hypothetical protein
VPSCLSAALFLFSAPCVLRPTVVTMIAAKNTVEELFLKHVYERDASAVSY